MLMRRLQRPLTTRTIAAAWRTRILLLPGRGSSQHQSRFSTTPRPPAPEDVQPQEDQEPQVLQQQVRQNKSSLFAELFPHEAKQRARRQQQQQSRESEGHSQQQPQPPPLQDDHHHGSSASSYEKPAPRTLSPLPQSSHPLISYYEDSSHHPASASTTRCTIMLSAASKHLSASDFYRVGAGRAAHVEGWVGGITKVVQARDPDTLEPLGRYYVTFETAAAASAWREEVHRLWQMSRVYTPGVVRMGGTKGTGDFAVAEPIHAVGAAAGGRGGGGVGGYANELAAAKREVAGFTLVAPGVRWDLETAKYTAEERALEHAGSLVEKLCRKIGTKFLVMVVVNGGRVTTETLRSAIRSDGEHRGLPWRIKNLEAKVGEGEWGITPFGKSSGPKPSQDSPHTSHEEHVQEYAGRDMGIDQEDNGGDLQRTRSESRRYPRFLVPFLDEAEARRFVRNWHRRQLAVRMDNLGAQGDSEAHWEENRVLNVTLLW